LQLENVRIFNMLDTLYSQMSVRELLHSFTCALISQEYIVLVNVNNSAIRMITNKHWCRALCN
jgi:hypothetical protein